MIPSKTHHMDVSNALVNPGETPHAIPLQVYDAHKRMLLTRLKVCIVKQDLEMGKEVHAAAAQCGYESCIKVRTALIVLYSKCGKMGDAREVFDCIKDPDVFSWTTIVLGYAENGEGFTALELFMTMKSRGYVPNSFTYVAALKACTSLATQKKELHERLENLEMGKQIYSEVGNYLNNHVQNTFIDLCAKCGSMVDAHRTFDSMKLPDVISWNSLIWGYAEHGEPALALNIFARMEAQGYKPSCITLLAAVKACTSLAEQDGCCKEECKELGRKIHRQIGCLSDINVQSALIDMYAKFGSMNKAHEVFDKIKTPDIVAWNALILGYADNGEGVIALDLFAKMKLQGHVPSTVNLYAALKACSFLGALECGRKIHAEIDPSTNCSVMVVMSLVDFYAKCGSLPEAQNVFDSYPKTRDMKTWTALMAGYSRLGDNEAVFGLLREMQEAGFQPNSITLLCILTCCSHAGLEDKAKEVLETMFAAFGVTPSIEHYTCILDMLGRLNKLEEAMELLRNIPCRRDSVFWMTVLCACRKWKNLGLGRLAFLSVVSLDSTNTAAYTLMARIYWSKGMWKEKELLLGLIDRFNVDCNMVGQSCWTNMLGDVHTFQALR